MRARLSSRWRRFSRIRTGWTSGPLVMSAAYTGAFAEDRFGELLAFSAPLPDRDLQYSNLGYNVASMAIAAKRPEGWKAYLDRNVFGPAGLNDIHHRVTGIPSRRIAKAHRLTADGSYATLPFLKRDLTMNAAGGHLASIRDLARWTILHLDEGKLDGRQIFPAQAIRRSHEILGRHNRQFAFFQRDGWGFGWDIGSYDGEPMVSRFGSYSGFRSHLSMLPARRVGVVAQVNAAPGWPLTDIIAAYAYDVFLGRADADARGQTRLDSLAAQLQTRRAQLARATPFVRTPPRPVADYTGRFESPELGVIDIVAERRRSSRAMGCARSSTRGSRRGEAHLRYGRFRWPFTDPVHFRWNRQSGLAGRRRMASAATLSFHVVFTKGSARLGLDRGNCDTPRAPSRRRVSPAA